MVIGAFEEVLAMARKATGSKKSRATASRPAQQSPPERSFTPETLDSTIIALPLLKDMDEHDDPEHPFGVVIDVNLNYYGGRDEAKVRIEHLIQELMTKHNVRGKNMGIHQRKSKLSKQYIFGKLPAKVIRELVAADQKTAEKGKTKHEKQPALYRIWPDFPVHRLTNRSIATVKADAARKAFSALGEDIIWAVLDSGIDRTHLHFQRHRNLELPPPLRHCDFTDLADLSNDESEKRALVDEAGHGTHVAGIIAGELSDGELIDIGNDAKVPVRIKASRNKRDEHNEVQTVPEDVETISGMAPKCKLVSFKVLDAAGSGPVSNLIAALEMIHEINGNGRHVKIHGVNMSVGYGFEPEWFACGQSPLCVEVDRLVRSGVVVVVAAGNTGYGFNETLAAGPSAAGLDLTINDPGNADLAITVGSTHRDMPHVYGVSYFSSKGPTGDGRMKPDVVAPGEKIISCLSSGGGGSVGAARAVSNEPAAYYKEDSGTSMAAPHVSGVIAAFLSIRREFIGQPQRVKEIFLATATDLRRSPYFQGKGLVDLMRAIQSV
jgi:serine protease AprX